MSTSSSSTSSRPSVPTRAWLRATLSRGLQAALVVTVLGLVVGFYWGDGGPQQDISAPLAERYASVPASLDDGEQIYQTRCMSCHQMNGRGVPGTFPPLQDTEWVNGDKGRLLRLLLNGLTGSMKVKGTTYSGVMPPWGEALSDEELAAVTTYIRSNFGNDAPPVTTEEVAKVRAATKNRTQPWTAKELKKEANQGIPGDSTASE